MNQKNYFVINSNDANQTIFNFVKKNYQTTPLSLIYKLFRNKKVKINNKTVKDYRYVLQVNDVIQIFDRFLENTKREDFHYQEHEADNHYQLQIIYEDENLLVVDKPAGLEMHSLKNNSLDSFVKNYLIKKNEYKPQDSQSFIISHLYRLDKFTRGLVIYPKNRSTMLLLMAKLTDKEYIQKYYLLECEGIFPANDLLVKGYIYHDEMQKKMIFNQKQMNSFSKECQTLFNTVKFLEKSSIVKAQLITGRKHQIRATMSFLHHPIINDRKYEGKKVLISDVFNLCAYKLTFNNFIGSLSYLNNCTFTLNYQNDDYQSLFTENIYISKKVG